MSEGRGPHVPSGTTVYSAGHEHVGVNRSTKVYGSLVNHYFLVVRL